MLHVIFKSSEVNFLRYSLPQLKEEGMNITLSANLQKDMNSNRFLCLSNDWDIAGIQSNPAFAPSFHLRINSKGLLFAEETQSLCSFIFDQRQEDVEIGKSSLFQLG